MKIGDVITIVPSLQLTEMKLDKLVGHKARIIENLTQPSRKNPGCWVELIGLSGAIGGELGNETIWFLPINSLSII